MPQVRPTARAVYFYAQHAQCSVLALSHCIGRNRRKVTGPARTGVVLCCRCKQRLCTAYAMVHTRCTMSGKSARKRPLGSLSARHLKRQRLCLRMGCQLCPPDGIGLLHGKSTRSAAARVCIPVCTAVRAHTVHTVYSIHPAAPAGCCLTLSAASLHTRIVANYRRILPPAPVPLYFSPVNSTGIERQQATVCPHTSHAVRICTSGICRPLAELHLPYALCPMRTPCTPLSP